MKKVLALAFISAVLTASGTVVSAQITGEDSFVVDVLTTGRSSFCHTFTQNLRIGSRGGDVPHLQTVLEREGFLSPVGAQARGIFGPRTRRAVISFQEKYGIDPAVGFVGPLTRATLNELYGCKVVPVGEDPSGGFRQAPRATVETIAPPLPPPTEPSRANLPPVIVSFSAPTTLTAGETGTWTIQASDPENGLLSYSVDWGDASFERQGFVQTTRFTHVYSAAGVYTIRFTVKDNAGLTAETATSVRVNSAPTFSCKAPGESQLDLATDGVYLYLVAWSGGSQYIYKMDKNCNVLTAITIGDLQLFGLTFDGVDFWGSVGSSGPSSSLVRLDSNFRKISGISLPFGAAQGIEYSNGKIWTVYNTATDEITVTDVLSGASEFKFRSPTDVPYGLAAAANTIWIGGGGTIYQLDKVTGKVVNSIKSPSAGGYLSGLVFDGEYLWIVDNNDDRIYRVTAKELPAPVTVGPVKTQYDITERIYVGWSPYFGDFEYYRVYLGNSIVNVEVVASEKLTTNSFSFVPESQVKEMEANFGKETLGNGYYIRVRALKTGSIGEYVVAEGLSGIFTIKAATQPSITVLSPNGGEAWNRGTGQEIRWALPTCTGGLVCPVVATVDVSLVPYYPPCTTSLCPSYPYHVPYIIQNGAPNTGSYKWSVGTVYSYEANAYRGIAPDGAYTVRICNAGDASQTACDSSDSYFKITSGTTAQYQIGDRVQTTQSVTVYSGPSLADQTLGKQAAGAAGAVVGGGNTAWGYTWWNVNFDSGADGWVIGSYLTKTPPTQPSITVLSPVFGETWFGGQSQAVRIALSGGIPSTNIFDIRLRDTAGQEYYLGSSQPYASYADLYLKVLLPSTIAPGKYLVEVKTAYNNQSYIGVSNGYITVTLPPLTLYYPGFFMSTDKTTYSPTDEVLLTLKRADGRSDPYALKLEALRDNASALLNQNILVSTSTTVAFRLSNYGIFNELGGGTYTLRVCQSGTVCVGGVNTNAILLSIITPPPPPPPTQPSITVLSPNGGETLRLGDTHIIRWTSQNIRSDKYAASIYLIDEKGAESYIVQSVILSAQNYNWTIPVNLQVGSYKVKIIVYGGSFIVSDYSDATFNIVAPDPLGRDTKRISDVYKLRVALELYYDAKMSYPVSLYALAPSYIVSVPVDPLGNMYFYHALTDGCSGEASNSCKNYHLAVNLEVPSNSALSSDSDENTSSLPGGINGSDSGPCRATGVTGYCYDIVAAKIAQPSTATVTVISPNGGEVWQMGTIQTLRWSTNNYPVNTPVSLSLFKKNATGAYETIKLISEATANDGSENFLVPTFVDASGVSNSYFVSVGCLSPILYPEYKFPNGCTPDTNDLPFSIVNSTSQPSITVLSPNGGETLNFGQPISVVWTSKGLLERQIAVTIVRPDGASCEFGITTASTLSITPILGQSCARGGWTLAAGQYYIQLYVVADSGITDRSNGPFTLIAPPITLFKIGDRVRVILETNVRPGPSLFDPLLASVPVGAVGTVVGGPNTSSGYTWWQIDYDSFADGWSISKNLEKVLTGVSGSASPSATARDTNLSNVLEVLNALLRELQQ